MWKETSIKKRTRNQHRRPSAFHLRASSSCEERQDTEVESCEGVAVPEGTRDRAVYSQSKEKVPTPLRKSYPCFLIISVVITWILHGWCIKQVTPPIPSDPAAAAAAQDMPVGVRCRRSERDEAVLTGASTSIAATLLPMITVLVPVYEGSQFIGQLMESLISQTYPCLEILVAIEPTNDAKQTQSILKQYQSSHPSLRMKFYQQKHRLHFAAITNWLYSRVEGEYYSYMACDDTILPNYYEVLAQCLNDNPQAVNCYPRVIYNDMNGKFSSQSNGFRQESVVGPQHERVTKVIDEHLWIPFRGVVRRPRYGAYVDGSMDRFSQPRLHKQYVTADQVVVLKWAIAGELIEVDVPYFKLVRPDSVSQSQMHNKTVLSIADYELGIIDEYMRKCNLVYSYAASSDDLVSLCLNTMLREMKWRLGNDRGVNAEIAEQSATMIGHSFLNRMFEVKRVAILGTTIQGCLMALMFRKHGYDVTLIDKCNDIMSRASIAGTRRIHLGLEYSNDPTMRTASYMVESALRFSSYIEYLVGHKIDWQELKSERIMFLVAKESLVLPQDFEAYAENLGNMYEALLSREPGLSYLGERPPKILEGKTKVPSVVNATMIKAAYESIEVGISSRKLKEIIRVALHQSNVNIVLGRTILDVKRKDNENKDKFGGLRVISNVGEHSYDAVVNSLGNAGIDQRMGLNNRAEHESYKVKASMHLPNHKSLEEISSISIINGPFGDIARYGSDDQLYFEWYPASAKFRSKNITHLSQFEPHANGDFPTEFEEQMKNNHRKAFQAIFPGVGDNSVFDSAVMGAEYVVANGEADIAYKDSGLHEMRDPPNVISDGYVSIETEHFTNAPFNVYQLEQELFVKDSLVSDK